jgi:hypothetical protein
MYQHPHKQPGFLYFLVMICLGLLIFYQAIITLILPFRGNILLLLIEIGVFFFMLVKIIWPN